MLWVQPNESGRARRPRAGRMARSPAMNPLPSPHQHPDVARRTVDSVSRSPQFSPLVVLAGCGLRTETPPPVEPTADAIEQVRGRTAADSIAPRRDRPGGRRDPRRDGRAARERARGHRLVLRPARRAGGRRVRLRPAGTDAVADHGRPRPPPAMPRRCSPTSPPRRPPSLTDADAVDDGALARLVASIGTSRAELTLRLAQASAVPAPPVGPAPDAAVPPTDPADPSADGRTDAGRDPGHRAGSRRRSCSPTTRPVSGSR